MHLLPLLFLIAAALAAFLTWFREAPPRRFASQNLALFLFIVGVILVFVVQGSPQLHFVTN